MLIHLNSIDEGNPANFKNTFSETLVIKPDSFVCMVGATITRKNHLQKIVFSVAGTLNVRFTPYDIVPITIPAGSYTPKQLADQINSNFQDYEKNDVFGEKCAICSLQAKATGTEPDQKIEFRFKWKGQALAEPYGLRAYMGQTNDYSQFLTSRIFGQADPNVKGTGSPISFNMVFGGNLTTYAFAPRVIEATSGKNPNGYTPPTSQVNKLVLNMACMTDNFIDNTFFLAQPNLTNIKFLIGSAVYDEVFNRYSRAATFGSGQWSNPADATNNCPNYISFKDDGSFDFYSLNVNTGAFDNIASNIKYHTGDFFNLSFDQETAPVNNPIPDHRMTSALLVHTKGNGNAFMYIMNMAGSETWNGFAPKANDLADYITARNLEMETLASYEAFWNNKGIFALRAPIGVRAGSGVQSENNYADSNNNNGFRWLQNGGVVATIDRQTANGRAYLNGLPLFQRYTAGAAPSLNADLKSTAVFSDNTAGGIAAKQFPFMWSYYFRLVDDTAKITGIDRHALINDTLGQRLVSVAPVQGEAFDVELFYDDGTNATVVLQDNLGTRINIQYATDYYMKVAYVIDNSSLNGTCSIEIIDVVADVSYKGTIVNSKNFANWSSISCSNHSVLQSYQKCLNGYFGHFRFHSVSKIGTMVSTYWDALFTELYGYINTGTKTKNYWWNYNDTVYANNIAQYQNIGLVNPQFTLTPVFHKDTLNANVKDTTWGDFVQPFFQHATYVPNTAGSRVVNLPEATYSGDEKGLADLSAFTSAIEFENVDRNDNIFVEPLQVGEGKEIVGTDDATYPIIGDVDDVLLEDKNINVEIPNLPHKSYNGVIRTRDKTIGQVPVNSINSERLERDNLDIISAYPPTKNWIALNNPGDIVLNELQVKLSDVKGVEIPSTEIAQETNVAIEIKNRNEIMN